MRFALGRRTCRVRRVGAVGAEERADAGTVPGKKQGSRAQIAKVALTVLLAAEFGLLDVAVRFDAYRVLPSLWLDALGSFVLWLFLLVVVRGKIARGGLLFVHSFAFLLALGCARYYNVPLDAQMAEAARRAWGDIRPIVARSFPVFLLAVFALTALLTWAIGEGPKLSARVKKLVPLLAIPLGAVGSPPVLASPDVRLVTATLAMMKKEPPRVRVGGADLPPLPSQRARLPNVLVVLSESLRADEICTVHGGPECKTFERIDALLPSRVSFTEARSAASYTAVSLSALVTGRTQEGPRDPLLTAPNVFDVVRSVRKGDSRPYVVYAASQIESVFESKDARAQVDLFFSAETLLGKPLDDIDEALMENDLDGKLADRLETEIPKLPEPFFLFVHLVATHAPYFEDPSDTPFKPASHVVTFGNLGPLRNAYKNSIHSQDARLARIVKAFIAKSGDAPRVTLFTSDHAEAFGEKGAIHHGQNLYDEQIHVPFFVDDQNGALSAEEHARLVARSSRSVTHFDFLPTLAGIYGVEDALGLRPHAAHFVGRNLVGPELPALGAVAITNCTGMFPCPVNTWGMLGEDHKLVMQAWDGEWRCVALGPLEHEVVPWDGACMGLLDASRGVYAKKPNGVLNK